MVAKDSDLSSILAELHRSWWRRWLVWAAVYLAGFALLSATGLAHGWPFYAWAIGWVLAKGLWDEAQLRRALKGRLGRHPDQGATTEPPVGGRTPE